MAAAHVLFTFYYDCSLGARIGALCSESYIDKEAMEQKKFGGFWTRFFFILGNVIAVCSGFEYRTRRLLNLVKMLSRRFRINFKLC